MMFESVFAALNDRNVRFLVVGGVAVVLHGYARLTADLDLVVDLAEEQATAAIEALAGLGLRPRVPVDPLLFAKADIREEWRTTRGMIAFTMHDPDNPMLSVDLLVDQSAEFDDLWARSMDIQLASSSVKVIALDDLIDMKARAGRPQDLLDATELRRIRDLKQDAP